MGIGMEMQLRTLLSAISAAALERLSSVEC
jgi:hypothetical protein